MPIDRQAALKRAEKFLRQGKLDGAIEEYVRLVEEQPRDWNTVNALGDLYARAGQADNAVAQFTRIADYLFDEGFFPRAAAVYKKSLKVKRDHEHTLLRLGEIAGRQGLLADAKYYFRQLADRRRARGDEQGAAECLIRLGTLDESDVDSRLAAARAARQIGATRQASSLLKSAAGDLERAGRGTEALDVLAEAAELDPSDVELRGRMARECVRAGQLDRARLFLDAESAGDDPDLLFALAQIELAAGKEAHARALLTRVLAIAPDRHGRLMDLAHELAREGRIESAFGCVDLIADAALLAADWDRAIAALQAFVADVPHVPALIKLVELCVDAGLDVPLREAQARLADAYLQEGRGGEARFIAEDLLDQEPESAEHLERLRKALGLLGVEDIDRVIAERVHAEPILPLPEPFDFSVPGPSDFATAEPVDVAVPESGEQLAPAAPVEAPVPEPDRQEPPHEIRFESIEIDLSDALAEMHAAARLLPQLPEAPGPPRDLESVFEDIRSKVSREEQATAAAAQYEQGLEHLRHGRAAEAIAELQVAARVPMLRFRAAAALGRLHVSRGDLGAAVEWLERAAEAPAPSPDEGFALLYDLADALERLGESARALAVLMELNADAGGYRDVRSRIDHLSRAQAGSHNR